MDSEGPRIVISKDSNGLWSASLSGVITRVDFQRIRRALRVGFLEHERRLRLKKRLEMKREKKNGG